MPIENKVTRYGLMLLEGGVATKFYSELDPANPFTLNMNNAKRFPSQMCAMQQKSSLANTGWSEVCIVSINVTETWNIT